MSDVTRLVDELTTLLYEVIKRWEVQGRVCEIVQCGACRKKADKPSSVVHDTDCPVRRLWQALELGEVVVRANAEEICDLEDERDARAAELNAIHAVAGAPRGLSALEAVQVLVAERNAIRADRDSQQRVCARMMTERDEALSLLRDRSPLFQDFEDVKAERDSLISDAFDANDYALLYRLIDEYTETAYKGLPRAHPSHRARSDLRDKITRHWIVARQRRAEQRQADAAQGEG